MAPHGNRHQRGPSGAEVGKDVRGGPGRIAWDRSGGSRWLRCTVTPTAETATIGNAVIKKAAMERWCRAVRDEWDAATADPTSVVIMPLVLEVQAIRR